MLGSICSADKAALHVAGAVQTAQLLVPVVCTRTAVLRVH